MRSKRFTSANDFWKQVESLNHAPEGTCFKLHMHIAKQIVDEMYQECLAFDGWTNHGEYTIQFGDEYALAEPGKHYFRGRYIAQPDKENFPRTHQFFKNFSDEFTNPVIQKLEAGAQIIVHNHGSAIPYTYNMSLNYPKGVKFAFYPQGIIPYTAGDIYKLYVAEDHAVRNDSDTDRYHIIFRASKRVYFKEGHKLRRGMSGFLGTGNHINKFGSAKGKVKIV